MPRPEIREERNPEGWPIRCSTCKHGRWLGWKIYCRKHKRKVDPNKRCPEWVALDAPVWDWLKKES